MKWAHPMRVKDAERARIVEQFNKGFTVRAIAEAHSVAPQTVRNVCREAGCTMRKPGPNGRGMAKLSRRVK
jgi:transposase-like protein